MILGSAIAGALVGYAVGAPRRKGENTLMGALAGAAVGWGVSSLQASAAQTSAALAEAIVPPPAPKKRRLVQ